MENTIILLNVLTGYLTVATELLVLGHLGPNGTSQCVIGQLPQAPVPGQEPAGTGSVDAARDHLKVNTSFYYVVKYLTFRLMAILRTCKYAHGCQTKVEKLAASVIQSMVFFLIPRRYARSLIQLEKCHNSSLAEIFLCGIM